MANKWAVKALELEEVISKYHCVPYLIYWDTPNGKYGYRRNGDFNIRLWYISFFNSIAGVIVCSTALIWILNKTNYEKIPLASCATWFFFICLGCLSVGINIVLFQYADDFVESLNHLIEYGSEIEVAEKKITAKSKSKNISVHDMVGLFGLGNVCFLHVVPFVSVPFGLTLHPQMDPTHWLLQQLLGADYPEELPNFQWYPISIARFILCFFFCSELLRTVSIMCTIMILESPIFYLCLNHYKRYTLDYSVLGQYEKLYRIRIINVKGCGELTSVSMGVCFIMMTFTNAACICCWELVNPAIFGCLVGAAIIQNGITHIVLPLVTKLYDLSNGVIEEWKIQVNQLNGPKKKIIKKILCHTRPISFACGNVGPLKKETKRNYFAALLDGFINIIMAFQELQNLG